MVDRFRRGVTTALEGLPVTTNNVIDINQFLANEATRIFMVAAFLESSTIIFRSTIS